MSIDAYAKLDDVKKKLFSTDLFVFMVNGINDTNTKDQVKQFIVDNSKDIGKKLADSKTAELCYSYLDAKDYLSNKETKEKGMEEYLKMNLGLALAEFSGNKFDKLPTDLIDNLKRDTTKLISSMNDLKSKTKRLDELESRSSAQIEKIRLTIEIGSLKKDIPKQLAKVQKSNEEVKKSLGIVEQSKTEQR